MNDRKPQTLRRRADNIQLRWSARLDSEFADRVFPWVAAGLLFVIFSGMALARVRTSGGGEDLGAYTQLAWLISRGDAAFSTVREANVFAEQAGFAFYPVARLAGVLPAVPTMVLVQAAMLALGVVPVWRIARRVADLRVGAGVVLMTAYALFPAVHEINLSGFQPASVALPALLGAVLFALTDRWVPYAATAALAVLVRADLALVVIGLGLLLVSLDRRRAGWWTAGLALAYLVVALALVQPYYADGDFVHAEAFEAYGSSVPGAAWGMLTSPFQVLGDVFTEDNFRILVMLLAPGVLPSAGRSPLPPPGRPAPAAVPDRQRGR